MTKISETNQNGGDSETLVKYSLPNHVFFELGVNNSIVASSRCQDLLSKQEIENICQVHIGTQYSV